MSPEVTRRSLRPASLHEDMTEILTILRLDVPPVLARTLHSTNPVVSR